MGLLLFLPFPGWQKLVGFITSATVLMYAGAPLALGALRHQKPLPSDPTGCRGPTVLCPASFISAGLIIYWSGWEVVWKLMVAVVLGYVLDGHLAAHPRQPGPLPPRLERRHLALALPGGPHRSSPTSGSSRAGRLNIPFYWDIVVVGAWSLLVYYAAIRLRLPEAKVDEYAQGVYGFES